MLLVGMPWFLGRLADYTRLLLTTFTGFWDEKSGCTTKSAGGHGTLPGRARDGWRKG